MSSSEHLREKAREYSKTHREQKNAYKRKWRSEHPGEVKEAKKRYRERHPEKSMEHCLAYRLRNPQKVRESNRRYKENHPEKERERCRQKDKRFRMAGKVKLTKSWAAVLLSKSIGIPMSMIPQELRELKQRQLQLKRQILAKEKETRNGITAVN